MHETPQKCGVEVKLCLLRADMIASIRPPTRFIEVSARSNTASCYQEKVQCKWVHHALMFKQGKLFRRHYGSALDVGGSNI